MPRETKAERERRIAKATDDLVARLTPSTKQIIKEAKEAARAAFLKTIIPFDGGRAVGDLTRAEAFEYSQRLVHLAHILNQAMPHLREARTLRRKSDPRAVCGQHTQHSSHASFIDEDEDRNPAGVARRR